MLPILHEKNECDFCIYSHNPYAHSPLRDLSAMQKDVPCTGPEYSGSIATGRTADAVRPGLLGLFSCYFRFFLTQRVHWA